MLTEAIGFTGTELSPPTEMKEPRREKKLSTARFSQKIPHATIEAICYPDCFPPKKK